MTGDLIWLRCFLSNVILSHEFSNPTLTTSFCCLCSTIGDFNHVPTYVLFASDLVDLCVMSTRRYEVSESEQSPVILNFLACIIKRVGCTVSSWFGQCKVACWRASANKFSFHCITLQIRTLANPFREALTLYVLPLCRAPNHIRKAQRVFRFWKQEIYHEKSNLKKWQ